MNVNGLTNSVSGTYTSYAANTKEAKNENVTADVTNQEAAVYEASAKTATEASSKSSAANNAQLIEKLKADAEMRTKQLSDIVQKLLTKQGTAYNRANGLKSLFEDLVVDDATRAQAQADIAEDGYWGVTQTSERIFDFAMALSGGDADKMEEMRDAFLKGFKKAEEMWGGKLPEISQNTYDAVIKKFDDYAEEQKQNAATPAEPDANKVF